MTARSINYVLAGSALLATAGSMVFSSSASAEVFRSRGKGSNIDISWIEHDPDDVLGLPGNTHIGYLYAYSGQWGTYVGGNVTDFDCEPGESPWGGHGIVDDVIDQAAETAQAAVGDAIDVIVDSGASAIDATAVANEVQGQLADEITDTIQDEFEEFPTCDFIQDRFLEGNETTAVSIDMNKQTAKISGTVNVTNGHGGGHGGDVTVIATPPVKVMIAGGEWGKWTYSSTNEGANWRYSGEEEGRGYYGGTVTGNIGPMGFADDADDEASGSFARTKYSSFERLR